MTSIGEEGVKQGVAAKESICCNNPLYVYVLSGIKNLACWVPMPEYGCDKQLSFCIVLVNQIGRKYVKNLIDCGFCLGMNV